MLELEDRELLVALLLMTEDRSGLVRVVLPEMKLSTLLLGLVLGLVRLVGLVEFLGLLSTILGGLVWVKELLELGRLGWV